MLNCFASFYPVLMGSAHEMQTGKTNKNLNLPQIFGDWLVQFMVYLLFCCHDKVRIKGLCKIVLESKRLWFILI